MTRRYDCIVVGAGSGGFGAALAAAREGLSVLLVERGEWLGGTASVAGVNVYEPGVGGTGLPFEIYKRLKMIPKAVGIYSIGRHMCWSGSDSFPGGESVIDPARRYSDTLRRHGAPPFAQAEAFARKHWHGVCFEPHHYETVLREMLDETGHCDVLVKTSIIHAEHKEGRIGAVTLEAGERVEAAFFVDATGGGSLCAMCGCERMLGQEPRSRFNEPGAPLEAASRVNGVTLVFRVNPASEAIVESLPQDIPTTCWWRSSFPPVSAVEYPAGGYCCNMLPTMEGEECLLIGYDKAYAECRRRVLATWHYIQMRFSEFQQYRLEWIAPMLGIRETHRVVGEYVLTEHDLAAGLDNQRHDDIITIADHPADRHGADGGLNPVASPYGIPFRCLIPKGFRNLLVACRGASFSSIAASSCRLSRTMMTLGQAAGTAVSLAHAGGIEIPDTQPEAIRSALRSRHVQLNWPMPTELADYIRNE